MVVVSIVVLIAESANARFLKALRVLRATRPLRVLTRIQSMLMVGWRRCTHAAGGPQRVASPMAWLSTAAGWALHAAPN